MYKQQDGSITKQLKVSLYEHVNQNPMVLKLAWPLFIMFNTTTIIEIVLFVIVKTIAIIKSRQEGKRTIRKRWSVEQY